MEKEIIQNLNLNFEKWFDNMKVEHFETQEEWMKARLGKITGTRLEDVLPKKTGKGWKIGRYELIAERLTISEEDADGYVPNETPIERGTRMQKYAIDRFRKETGKKVNEDIVLWSREDEPSIAVSPDGVISPTEAVETKCLSSARHVEAYLMKVLPSEYYYQTLQYFIVNEKLQRLHVVFYDTRLPAINYFVIEINRKEIEEAIKENLLLQIELIKEIDKILKDLTF